ncbi:MAG: hypothetical protein EBU97_07180, partial [Rhodobacteraceae bacterium]|nr:hypothetical protein [Paracoccaceae bacterium]
MPPVAAAVSAVSTFAASLVIGITGSAAAAAWTYGITSFLITRIGLSLAAAFVMKALSPKPSVNAIDQGQELTLKFDAAYPRE